VAGKWGFRSPLSDRWGISRRINERVRIAIELSAVSQGFFETGRPQGVYSGRWISIGPVFVRLGRRSSWRDEDLDAEMIEPVEPGS
jgi:hypothetical protein